MAAPFQLDSRLRAEALVTTDAETEALGRLRELTGDVDGPMERHGVRCHVVCVELAASRGVAIDEEVSLVAGLLHDIGLYEGASGGGVYVSDGAEYTRRFLADRPDWPQGRIALCVNAVERHHELRSQWEAGPEVELLRRADLFELSLGAIGFGTDRAWRRRLFAAVPRSGLYGEVGRMVLKAVRERPATLPRIFLRN